MWPWALNIKYTHATAVQTSEHCSFPNYSTQATATAQSIVVVVPSRIIPSSYPRITTTLLRPACAALTSYCACPVPTSDATVEQMGCTCRQITVQSSRFIEGGAKVLFSDILSCQPIRVRGESSAFLWPCVPLTRGHARALVTCCSLQQRMGSILAIFLRQCVYASEHLVSSERKLAAKPAN